MFVFVDCVGIVVMLMCCLYARVVDAMCCVVLVMRVCLCCVSR